MDACVLVSMGVDFARGFAIESEWYWRIAEHARTFDAAAAVRDFLIPLARVAKDLAISEIAADNDTAVRFVLAGEPVTIEIDTNVHDRAAINQFVLQLDRVLAATQHTFVILSLKRYELRGVLVCEAELGELLGTNELVMPSGRTRFARGSSVQIPRPGEGAAR